MNSKTIINQKLPVRDCATDGYTGKKPFVSKSDSDTLNYKVREDIINVFKDSREVNQQRQDISVGLEVDLISTPIGFKLLKYQWDSLYQKCDRSTVFFKLGLDVHLVGSL